MANAFSARLTLKEWLNHWGWHWVDGQEQLHKGLMGVIEAADLVQSLKEKGAITNG